MKIRRRWHSIAHASPGRLAYAHREKGFFVRRFFLIIVSLAMSLGLLAGFAGSASAAASVSTPKASPKKPMRNTTFTMTGRVGTTFSRTVILQATVGGRWKKVATAKTTETGRYTFKTRTGATKRSYRVVAPGVTYQNHRYARLVSKARIVTTRPKVTRATQVTAGYDHTCAVTSTHKVKCWGENDVGQLGDGTRKDRHTPVTVRGLSNAVAVTTGSGHTCALTDAGTVKCWGENNNGQLADGTHTERHTPVTAVGLTGITAIAAHMFSTCAVTRAGAVICWGDNTWTDLLPGGGASLPPTAIPGLTNVTAIAAGDRRTCVLTATGTVECWTWAYASAPDRNIPTTVAGISHATAIATSGSHSCALISGGTVKCWGENGKGQLGDGTTTDRNVPVTVHGIVDARAITVGAFHSCAALRNGTVKCWGGNYYGQLGGATKVKTSRIPLAVPGVRKIKAITSTSEHTCGLMTSGGITCWGDNFYGMIGDGTSKNQRPPVRVRGFG